jgi:hypothetical protein
VKIENNFDCDSLGTFEAFEGFTDLSMTILLDSTVFDELKTNIN